MNHTTSAVPEVQGKPFLLINNLVKDFGDNRVVNQVSVAINKGEIFALLGSSGCGKSTLLRMLAGFETPTSGEIVLNGKNIVADAPYHRPINMMFQSYALFPHLTVWDNIAFGLRREGMEKQEIAERVEKMLALVQLQSFGKRKPFQLSGGQQQMVSLGRALLSQPRCLLLDEPSIGLAPKLFQDLLGPVRALQQERGMSILIVEQNVREALRISDRVMVMKSGEVIREGPPADFTDNAELMELY